jgi:hypothetical protein
LTIATILTVSQLTAGCATTSAPTNSSVAPNQAEQIESWRRDHRPAFTALGDALVEFGDALTANDWNAIHAACSKASEPSHTMRAALPTPDEKLTAALSGVVDNLDAAIAECPHLNASSDQIDANLFTKHLSLVGDEFQVVKQIMK